MGDASRRGRNSPLDARRDGEHPGNQRRTLAGTGVRCRVLFESLLEEAFEQ